MEVPTQRLGCLLGSHNLPYSQRESLSGARGNTVSLTSHKPGPSCLQCCFNAVRSRSLWSFLNNGKLWGLDNCPWRQKFRKFRLWISVSRNEVSLLFCKAHESWSVCNAATLCPAEENPTICHLSVQQVDPGHDGITGLPACWLVSGPAQEAANCDSWVTSDLLLVLVQLVSWEFFLHFKWTTLKKKGYPVIHANIWNLNLSVSKCCWKTGPPLHAGVVCGCCSIKEAELRPAGNGLQSWKYSPPAPLQTRLPAPHLLRALPWEQGRSGEVLPLLSEGNEERSECALALDADVDVMATFWNSLSSTSCSPHFPCLPHSYSQVFLRSTARC